MAKTAKAVEERDPSLVTRDPSDERRATSQADSKKQVSAQRVEFSEAVGTEAAGSPGKLDIILDMNIPITVAIGRTEMPVRRLLQLGPGSVLKLNKPIGAPVDLFLKDSKFAEADVVVVDERFAVRIKQIIGASEA